MGIGGTAKKLQKVAEMGEELYKRINDLRAQVAEMRETVTATHNRVDRLEKEVAEQRAILQALAEREGIDVDALIAEAHISEAESGVTADAGGEASPDADAGGASDDTSAGAADADDATDEPSGSDSTSDSESTRDST
jgi:chromosome segregation ATPase